MISTITILILVFIIVAMVRIAYADFTGYFNEVIFAFNSIRDNRLHTQSSIIRATADNSPISPNNPHWDNTKCNYCHDEDKGIPPSDGNGADLNDALCLECHEDDVTHTYIHPVGLKISNDRRSVINELWNGDLHLDEKGVMTCHTCHDLLDQCLAERTHQKSRNPRFLRGGPFPNRFTLCYRCHDSSQYERVNSHDQITKHGYLKMNKCRLCHEIDTNERVKSGIIKDLIKFPLLKNMDDDRTQLCIRCHRKIDHPSSAFTIKSHKKYRHLVRIDNNKKRSLESMIRQTGIKLPIEPNTERIYCGTCHQPHQPGVFAGEKQTGVVMENHRLRSAHICKFCHEIYDELFDGRYQQ
ncbi:MAG: hypothetical protein ABW096_13970 [Candidatus Thiodiazotropha sp.]